jgi:hypothetical protein
VTPAGATTGGMIDAAAVSAPGAEQAPLRPFLQAVEKPPHNRDRHPDEPQCRLHPSIVSPGHLRLSCRNDAVAQIAARFGPPLQHVAEPSFGDAQGLREIGSRTGPEHVDGPS